MKGFVSRKIGTNKEVTLFFLNLVNESKRSETKKQLIV